MGFFVLLFSFFVFFCENSLYTIFIIILAPPPFIFFTNCGIFSFVLLLFRLLCMTSALCPFKCYIGSLVLWCSGCAPYPFDSLTDWLAGWQRIALLAIQRMHMDRHLNWIVKHNVSAR